jgi:hypothetical protein
MQKMSANDTPQTTVLVLATLDDMIQIEVTLIVLHHPMWSKQNMVADLKKNFSSVIYPIFDTIAFFRSQ